MYILVRPQSFVALSCTTSLVTPDESLLLHTVDCD